MATTGRPRIMPGKGLRCTQASQLRLALPRQPQPVSAAVLAESLKVMRASKLAQTALAIAALASLHGSYPPTPPESQHAQRRPQAHVPNAGLARSFDLSLRPISLSYTCSLSSRFSNRHHLPSSPSSPTLRALAVQQPSTDSSVLESG